MFVYGDYLLAPQGVYNLTDEGHGQIWQSLSGNITVGSSGVIDGVGLGFPSGVGPGGGGTLPAHGGLNLGVGATEPYGNASAPTSLGSGADSSARPGGSAIKLDSDILTVEGTIDMQGEGASRAGAGGSIWLKANKIEGNGTIDASGGEAVASGGTGGRIRLGYASVLNLTGKIDVGGGSGSEGVSKGGTLTFTNNTWQGEWNLTGNIGLLGGDYGEGETLNVLGNFDTNNYNITIYGDCFGNSGAPKESVCYNTTANGKGVWINASGNVTISSGSVLDGIGSGFPGGVGPDTSQRPGHGGSRYGTIYGNETQPTSLGSGADTAVRYGGSAIKLETSNRIIVNGIINVKGSNISRGGAGGSVWLKADNISGTGMLNSSGGSAAASGGGGGRISLTSTGVVEFSGVINNKGGKDTADGSEDNSGGTIYINASTSIISSGNIITVGYNGGNITFVDTLLTLSGIYNASNTTGGTTWETITTNYTDCSSSFTGTFEPGRIDQANGDCGVPNASFVSPTPANASTQSNTDIFVNLSTADESGDHYAFVDFDDSLVLWMRMDDTNSTGDPTDLSSYSNNGSLQGDALINSTGYFGDGSHYDGDEDYIEIPESASIQSINDTKDVTVMLWVYRIGSGGSEAKQIETVVYKGPWGGNNDVPTAFGFLTSNNGNNASSVRIGTTGYGGGPAFSNNQWHHIGFTVNSAESNLTIYTDGEVNSSFILSANISLDSNSIRIADVSDRSYNFNGTIDEVLIFNRSLSAGEISALYNASAVKYENNFTGLSAGTHTFTGHAVDLAGNKNDTEELSVTISDTTLPNASFVAPTPANGSTQSNTDIFVNLSTADDSGDHYAFVDFDDSLVLWMRMDDTNSSGDPTDLSSYSNNGSLVGNAKINSTGYWGDAGHFDGDGDYVQMSNTDSGFSDGNISISLWIYPSDVITNQYVTCGRVSSISNKRCVLVGYQDNNFNIFNNAAYPTGTASDTQISATANVWQHIVYVSDGSRLRGYKDGSLIVDVSANLNVASGNIDTYFLGSSSASTPGNFFTGAVDDVLFFNRTLNETEIIQRLCKSIF